MKTYCEKEDLEEVSDLKAGMDFRNPQCRREVFLRFYEFHLKYRAHAGAVYYILPYLFRRMGLTEEQKLWFAYINGCSQNALTTYMIFKEFPDHGSVKMSHLELFWKDNAKKMGWDTDRRYVRTKFPRMVENYLSLVGGQQSAFFGALTPRANPRSNFAPLWDAVISDFDYFGRLATFSYIEYLKIVGLNVDCDRLFLDDISGSKSHRNGIMKVAGRDDYDWTDQNPVEYDGEVIGWAEDYADGIMEDMGSRITHEDLSFFTLETTLCNYKGWHRVNRRYPNVYNDMFRDRIKVAERQWRGEDFSIFWDARKEYLPSHLRIEDNPRDLGLHQIKQNHYRLTGEVVMMDKDWECFRNEYNDKFTN